MVNEIKLLIKEQKRAGKSGLIDLTSEEISAHVSERQLWRKRGQLPQGIGGDASDPNADGLISAMAQLAWEQDIDLTKGKTFNKRNSTSPILEEGEANSSTNSSAGDRTPLLRSTEGLKTVANLGIDNPLTVSDGLPPVPKSKKDLEMKEMRSSGPALRSPKVAPQDSPANGDPKAKKKKKAEKLAEKLDKSSKPPSARSGSGRSKDSKDSSLSEERTRQRVNLAVTGSRSSLNSASSLTSLLHAWDSKTKNTSDDSEF